MHLYMYIYIYIHAFISVYIYIHIYLHLYLHVHCTYYINISTYHMYAMHNYAHTVTYIILSNSDCWISISGSRSGVPILVGPENHNRTLEPWNLLLGYKAGVNLLLDTIYVCMMLDKHVYSPGTS